MARSRYFFKKIFWKTKVWSLHFQQSHSFNVCYDGVHNKRRFTWKKQVLLCITIRSWLALKQKNRAIFSDENVHKKVSVVLKLSAFCFDNNSSFSFPLCCISFILHLVQLVFGSKSRIFIRWGLVKQGQICIKDTL